MAKESFYDNASAACMAFEGETRQPYLTELIYATVL